MDTCLEKKMLTYVYICNIISLLRDTHQQIWQAVAGKGGAMEDVREFIAYSRKLLRSLEKIKKALDADDIDTARVLVNELIEDTQRDIEA